MRVIPWENMKIFLEKYSDFYFNSITKRVFTPHELENLFLKMNDKWGFDIEVENDSNQS